MIPAALAWIVGNEHQGSIRPKQAELPDAQIGRADLKRRSAFRVDLEDAPAGSLRIVDERVFDLSPDESLGAVGGAAVKAAIGGKHEDRRAVFRPADVLDRPRNTAERPHGTVFEHEEIGLA